MDDGSSESADEAERLAFLHAEGLELLALFRSIRDKAKRDVITQLVRIVAEGQTT